MSFDYQPIEHSSYKSNDPQVFSLTDKRAFADEPEKTNSGTNFGTNFGTNSGTNFEREKNSEPVQSSYGGMQGAYKEQINGLKTQINNL